MIPNTFKVHLSTLHKPLKFSYVKQITIPGKEGEFTVLKGHEDMLALLKQGIVTIDIDHETSKEYLISDGICRVRGDLCELMTENLLDLQKTNLEEIEDNFPSLPLEIKQELTVLIKQKKSAL